MCAGPARTRDGHVDTAHRRRQCSCRVQTRSTQEWCVASCRPVRVRTAIFDFDGTVADTFDAVVQVLNTLASEYGYRSADAAEVQQLRGLPPTEVAQRLGVAWPKVPQIVARVRKEMIRSMPLVQPCQGVPEALRLLQERGLSIGLLTSNSRENVDLFLERHPIAFEFISTGSGLWSKHRRLASLMRRRKLIAAETAYIGDEIRDIEAGRKLGMRVIAVSWGYTAPSLLAQHKPDQLLTRADELLTALI
ncbi:MAG TPA: HAD-IA family hydrolase [Polyangiales bacterium]|nr:HAD-IA family hydrolase [Polyangiales bacterium]